MMVYLFAQKCCRQIKLLLDKVSNWGPYGTFYSEKIGRNLWCFMGFFIQKEVWKANFKCKLSKLQVSDEGNWQWAIDIWEDFVKLIKLFVVTVRSKQLKQYIMQQLKRVSYQSFDLHLLRNVAARLNCFLTKFQTDGPMGAFHSEEMSGISWWLMGFFTQKEILKTYYTCRLSKLQVSDESNWKLIAIGTEISKPPTPRLEGILGPYVERHDQENTRTEPNFLKLVQVFAVLDPDVMVLLQSETEKTFLTQSLVSCMVRKVLLWNMWTLLKSSLMTFFKKL